MREDAGTPDTLCDYERRFLNLLNGGDADGLTDPLDWGAALSEALEYLKGRGFVSDASGTYQITPAGRAALTKGGEDA